MSKISWKPGNMVYPLPAVMVSCGADASEYNIITISWTGTTCSDPAMCYISVRPSRHSHAIISRTGEFVINLTTEALAFQTDWCGVKSGRDFNKFDAMKLTPGKALVVSAPIIEECPVHIECRVTQVIPLGSHDMFMAEVVAVQVDSAFLDPKTDEFRLQDAHLLAYSHGHYYPLGAQIGRFGHSVKKQKK